MTDMAPKKKRNPESGVKLIYQSSIWPVLPYIVGYEALAVLETLLLTKYGNTDVFQTTETIRNTFNIIVGLVVGYVMTISFEAGMNKFSKSSQRFYEGVLYGTLTLAIEVTSLLQSKRSRGQMHGGSVPTTDCRREIEDIIEQLRSVTVALPMACRCAITAEVAKKRKSISHHSQGKRSHMMKNIHSYSRANKADPEMGSDSLPALKHKTIYNSMNLSSHTVSELNGMHFGDTTRTIQTWYIHKIYSLNRLDAFDDKVGYNRCIEHVNSIATSVSEIQCNYAIGIPPVYKKFVAAVIHLYMLCVPILIYTQDLWWITLVIYPVVVYLFVSPHVIGSKISETVDYGNSTTKLPVDVWCSDMGDMINAVFGGLEGQQER